HRFQPALPYLQTLHGDLESIGRLIAAGQTSLATQAIERDLSSTVQTTRRFLAQHGRMAMQVEDRDKAKGVDEFGQPFVVVGPNLAALVQVRQDLGWAAVLQLDVNQKTRRLIDAQTSKPSGEPLWQAIHTQTIIQALERQQKVNDLVQGVRRTL